MLEKAASFATMMKQDDFKASNGWFDNFKKRNNISFKVMAGESESVASDVVDKWTQEVLPKLIEGWDPKDIYNCDESGLFFKMLPNKTMHTKGEACHGSKKSKERVTVMFCANMDGSDKYKLAVIGKYNNPRCFKNVGILPVQYMAQKNAWMDSDRYKTWVQRFDNKMARQGRKVLLFMDNVSSHNKYVQNELNLTATTIKYFPPNTTSHLQPMDQGIIQACKMKYRRRLLQRVVADIEAGLETKIDLKEAVHIISKAWDSVSAETISNCFRKAGFVLAQSATDNTDVSSVDQGSEDNRLMRNMWDFISDQYSLTVTLDDWVGMDDGIDTDATNLTEEAIVESVMEPECEATQTLNDESETPTTSSNIEEDNDRFKTYGQALKCARSLRNFLLEKGLQDESQLLDRIEDCISKKVAESCNKQTKITDFLK